VSEVLRGRLDDATSAPASGERVTDLVRLGNVVIRQVVSGTITPVDYDEAEDEWAVVLGGAATLEVAGDEFELRARDWVLLPARTPHRLVRAEPGTSWITMHTRRG
jgi:quercetin dioxygenase-like cupin family protein